MWRLQHYSDSTMLEWSKAPILSYPGGTFPAAAQGMVLGAVFDLNVMWYPMLILMKARGVLVGRGGASPRPSGKAEPTIGRRARRSPPSVVGRGGAGP